MIHGYWRQVGVALDALEKEVKAVVFHSISVSSNVMRASHTYMVSWGCPRDILALVHVVVPVILKVHLHADDIQAMQLM